MSRNSIDNISIPENIDKVIDSAIEKGKKQRKYKKAINRKVIGGIAATIAIIITLQISIPTFAENIPILKEIFKVLEKSENGFISPNNYSEHTQNIGLSQECNGITISIEEAVFDGHFILLSYKIESKENFPYLTWTYPTEFITDEEGVVIGGKDFKEEPINRVYLQENISVDYSNVSSIPITDPRVYGTLVGSNTFIGLRQYPVIDWKENEEVIEKVDVPDSFNLNIKIPSVSFPTKNSDPKLIKEMKHEEFVVEGPWEFNVPIKLDTSKIEEIEINEVKEGFLLKNIKKTPLITEVNIVPLNEENKQNLTSPDGIKVSQLHRARLIDNNGTEHGIVQPLSSDIQGNIDGSMQFIILNEDNVDVDYYQIIVEDNVRSGEPCTKECDNIEDHENYTHPKIIKFDTKIKVN